MPPIHLRKFYYFKSVFVKSDNQSQNIVAQPLFFLKNFAYSPRQSPLFNVERVWKLFEIAQMAAWYICKALDLKCQHWNGGRGFAPQFLSVIGDLNFHFSCLDWETLTFDLPFGYLIQITSSCLDCKETQKVFIFQAEYVMACMSM